MIPKIIHYCWLSNDPLPKEITGYIEGWKNKMPDYEFMLWDTKMFDINSTKWTKQAFDKRKYAFASDYIRLFALYNYGGIYLDTDVEVLKKYDDFLHLNYFIGLESNQSYLECATFGAEPKCVWIKQCMDYYKDRPFILPNGEFDVKTSPHIMRELIENKYIIKKLDYIPDRYEVGINSKIPTFYCFASDFFSPKSYFKRTINTTNNTYSIHQFATAWRTPWQKFKLWTKVICTYIMVHIFGSK